MNDDDLRDLVVRGLGRPEPLRDDATDLQQVLARAHDRGDARAPRVRPRPVSPSLLAASVAALTAAAVLAVALGFNALGPSAAPAPAPPAANRGAERPLPGDDSSGGTTGEGTTAPDPMAGLYPASVDASAPLAPLQLDTSETGRASYAVPVFAVEDVLVGDGERTVPKLSVRMRPVESTGEPTDLLAGALAAAVEDRGGEPGLDGGVRRSPWRSGVRFESAELRDDGVLVVDLRTDGPAPELAEGLVGADGPIGVLAYSQLAWTATQTLQRAVPVLVRDNGQEVPLPATDDGAALPPTRETLAPLQLAWPMSGMAGEGRVRLLGIAVGKADLRWRTTAPDGPASSPQPETSASPSGAEFAAGEVTLGEAAGFGTGMRLLDLVVPLPTAEESQGAVAVTVTRRGALRTTVTSRLVRLGGD